MAASVSLFLRNDKKLSGKRPIYLRIIIDRKVKNYSTGKTLLPEYWDENRESVKSGYGNYRELNTFLNTLKLKAEKIILDIQNENLQLTLQNFDIRFSDNESKGRFVTWAIEYLDHRKFKVSPEYTKQMFVIIAKFDNWRQNLRFSDLTRDLIDDYENYLYSIGNGRNTVSNNLKRIKFLCDIAAEKGFIKKSPFAGVKLKWNKTEKEILSFNDIIALEKKLPDMPVKVQHSLHAFLFALYHGGLRFSDLLQLKPESLRQDGIYLVQHKTLNSVFIPWNPAGMHHLPTHTPPGIPIFHIISEQKFRDHLKLAAMYAEVKTEITTRTARHTFISLSSALGMNFKMISQIAGHSSVKMTERYHHPQSLALIEEMKKWNFNPVVSRVQKNV